LAKIVILIIGQEMGKPDKSNSALNNKKELIQCPVCDDYFRDSEGFCCPKCKKGPICKRHRVVQRKECASCTIDLKLPELKAIREQEKSLGHFLRFLQFVFTVVVIYFIAFHYGLLEAIDFVFMQNNFIAQNLIPIGIIIIVLLGIAYTVLYSQKKKADDIESYIEKIARRT
jgi:hypothetical protein